MAGRIDELNAQLRNAGHVLSKDEKRLASRRNNLKSLQNNLERVLEKARVDYKRLPTSDFPNGLEGSYLRHISKAQLDRISAVVGCKGHH